jgi:hypothetical protein
MGIVLGERCAPAVILLIKKHNDIDDLDSALNDKLCICNE